jgi:protein-S-isoprenylcysteine O-methyltransferase Ste14
MLLSISLVFLVVSVYGFIHSLLASLKAKVLARDWFGSSADRWYRLAYNLFATLSLLPVLALLLALPDIRLYAIPFPWVLITLAIQFLAMLALAVGLLQTGVWSFLGLRQLIGPPEAGPPRLVVTGLNGWVRHPLYTAGLVFIWLSPVMTVNLLTLNVGLTLYIVIGAWLEERKLWREFGETYAEYRERTPMLVPGIKYRRRKT